MAGSKIDFADAPEAKPQVEVQVGRFHRLNLTTPESIGLSLASNYSGIPVPS